MRLKVGHKANQQASQSVNKGKCDAYNVQVVKTQGVKDSLG